MNRMNLRMEQTMGKREDSRRSAKSLPAGILFRNDVTRVHTFSYIFYKNCLLFGETFFGLNGTICVNVAGTYYEGHR